MPTTLAANCISKAQDDPALIGDARQGAGLTAEKSPLFAPVMLMLEIERGASPVFMIATGNCALFGMPTGCDPKFTLAELNDTLGFVAAPAALISEIERRLRVSEPMRRLVRETRLDPANFILPLFIVPGEGVRNPIGSMPPQCQLSIDLAVEECRAFEIELYRFLENSRPAILSGIREKKIIDDALKADLTAAINEVKARMKQTKGAKA